MFRQPLPVRSSESLPSSLSSSSPLSLFYPGFQQGVSDPPLLTTHPCCVPTASSCSILRVITFFLIFIITAIFVLSRFPTCVPDPPLLTTHPCYVLTASSCSILRVITFFLIFIVTAIFVLSRFPTRCSRPTFIDNSSLLCSDSLFLFDPQSHYLLLYLHRHLYRCFIQVSNKVFPTHLHRQLVLVVSSQPFSVRSSSGWC